MLRLDHMPLFRPLRMHDIHKCALLHGENLCSISAGTSVHMNQMFNASPEHTSHIHHTYTLFEKRKRISFHYILIHLNLWNIRNISCCCQQIYLYNRFEKIAKWIGNERRNLRIFSKATKQIKFSSSLDLTISIQ